MPTLKVSREYHQSCISNELLLKKNSARTHYFALLNVFNYNDVIAPIGFVFEDGVVPFLKDLLGEDLSFCKLFEKILESFTEICFFKRTEGKAISGIFFEYIS